MQVVEVITAMEARTFCGLKPVEARVRWRRRDHQVHEAERGDERRPRNYQEHEGQREVEHVLARVHGDAGPRPRVDVAMMQRVEPAVDRVDVEQPVVEVEVHAFDPEHGDRHRSNRPK